MISTNIEKIVKERLPENEKLNIFFKQRPSIFAYFVKADDFDELKAKNFWRVVNIENIDEWNKTQNTYLTRLFNGNEFSKLK